MLWLRIGFGIAVLVAGGLYLASQWANVSDALALMGLLPIVGSLLPAVCGFIAAMAGWRVLLSSLGAPLTVRDAGRVFFTGQLGKYLPGSVWTLIAHVELGHDLRIPRTVSFGASLLALMLSVAMGLILGIALLPFGTAEGILGAARIAIAVPILFAILHPKVGVGGLNLVLRLCGQPPVTARLTWRETSLAAIYLALSWVFLGLHCYVLILGYAGDPVQALPIAIGAFALAYCAGLLFLPAPGGLGVREVVLVSALGLALPPMHALTVAVVSRFVLLVVDATVVAVWWSPELLARRRSTIKHVTR